MQQLEKCLCFFWKWHSFVGCLLLAIMPLTNLAQSPAMWHLGAAQGLPSMTVYQLVQDQQGFIWLGTAKGLYRYDGRHFEKQEIPDFLDEEIVFLQIDPWNRIWINNLSGQIAWLDDGQLHALDKPSLAAKQFPQRFNWVGQDLWVSYSDQKAFRYARYSFDENGVLKPIKFIS